MNRLETIIMMSADLVPSHQLPSCWLGCEYIYLNTIKSYNYHVTTIKQIMFMRDWEVGNPPVSLLMAGSPQSHNASWNDYLHKVMFSLLLWSRSVYSFKKSSTALHPATCLLLNLTEILGWHRTKRVYITFANAVNPRNKWKNTYRTVRNIWWHSQFSLICVLHPSNIFRIDWWVLVLRCYIR